MEGASEVDVVARNVRGGSLKMVNDIGGLACKDSGTTWEERRLYTLQLLYSAF